MCKNKCIYFSTQIHNVRWISGTQHGYHGVTFGLYVNELVKRVDPYKRDLYVFFKDEIAVPFGKYDNFAVAHRTTVDACVDLYIVIQLIVEHLPRHSACL